MNVFLATRFDELVQRLAIGFEPIDAGRSAVRVSDPTRWRMTPVAHSVALVVESTPVSLTRRPLRPRRFGREIDDYRPLASRSCGGRHVLLYARDLDDRATVDVRIFDPCRRIVPRRLRFPLAVPQPSAVLPAPKVTLADVDAAPLGERLRRPFLFPGAAYDVSETATGLRGRVVRNGAPMRWARVLARLPGTTTVVGRAHGDDRGEFLLLVDAGAGPVTDLGTLIDVEVEVFGPGTPPAPPTAPLRAGDPIDSLWGLPLEIVTLPGWPVPDRVSAGIDLPASPTAPDPSDYTASVSQVVHLRAGRIASSSVSAFVLP
jgi:hypothetical protein